MSWFKNLSPTWQSLIVLGAAVTFGFIVAGVASGYAHLPGQVAEQAEDLEKLTTRVEKVEVNQQDILEAIQFSNCMDVAAAKGDPWQVCDASPIEYLRRNR